MSRRSLAALAASALCAAFAVAVWALVFHTATGRAADEAAFAGFVQLQWTSAGPVAFFVASLCDALPYAVIGGLLALHALRARGVRWAVAVATVLVGSGAVTQFLKTALAAPRMDGPLASGAHVVEVSWPSGHATAAMALALCAVMVAPPAARRLTAVLGGLFAIAVAYSVVLLGWHMPSDALGGFAVAGAFTGLAFAALWAAEARWPAGTARGAASRALTPGAGPAAAVALAVVAAVVLRAAVQLPGPEHQLAFLTVAGAIVALALLLAAAAAAARAQR